MPATIDRQLGVTRTSLTPGLDLTPAVSDRALLMAARGGSALCRAELWERHGTFAEEMLSWFGFIGRAADVCREELDALLASDETAPPCKVVAAQYFARVAARGAPEAVAAPPISPTHTSRAFAILTTAEQTLLWHVWANGASVVDAARYAGVSAASAMASLDAAALQLRATWVASRRTGDMNCGHALEHLQRALDSGICQPPQLNSGMEHHRSVCHECENAWEAYSAIPDLVSTHFGILVLRQAEA